MRYARANDILSLEQGQVDPLQQRLGHADPAGCGNRRYGGRRPGRFRQRPASERQGFSPAPDHPGDFSQLQSRALGLEQELTSLRTRLGENWPSVVEKRNELALVLQQLDLEKVGRRGPAATTGPPRPRKRRGPARAGQPDPQPAEGAGQQLPRRGDKYNILKREVETNRNLYDGLLERLRQTGVLAGFQFGNIQLVEPGRPSRIVDSPRVAWNLGLAVLLGLSLGVCLVLLLDSWDTSIATPEEAEHALALPLLGGVPLMRERPRDPLLVGPQQRQRGQCRQDPQPDGARCAPRPRPGDRCPSSSRSRFAASAPRFCCPAPTPAARDRGHLSDARRGQDHGRRAPRQRLCRGRTAHAAGRGRLRKPELSRIFGIEGTEGPQPLSGRPRLAVPPDSRDADSEPEYRAERIRCRRTGPRSCTRNGSGPSCRPRSPSTRW